MADYLSTDAGTAPKAWFAGVVGWMIPGAGHLLIGRIARGLLLGAIIWTLFFLGLMQRGRLFGIGDTDTGLLAYVFGFFDLGMGALYFAAIFLGLAGSEQSADPASEYGNVFFMIAGLLNYLISLDVFDIESGRKS